MTTSIIDSIQKSLGYPELSKVDPNTQQATVGESAVQARHFGQAAIPAVLMGIYKLGSTEQGAQQILQGSRSSGWLDVLFGENKQEAIQSVAGYASDVHAADAESRMESIAREAVTQIRRSLPTAATFSDVKSFVSEQRSNILKYLPAGLHIGSVVDDNTIDDRTNKMEGPMSGAMHFFEKLFSGSSTEKNDRDGYDDLK